MDGRGTGKEQGETVIQTIFNGNYNMYACGETVIQTTFNENYNMYACYVPKYGYTVYRFQAEEAEIEAEAYIEDIEKEDEDE